MADQNITELPIKTNTGVANTDYMLGIDASEGYQILVRDVAKYIVENYNGSTLAGSAQTPKSAIDTLNSNMAKKLSIWQNISGATALTSLFNFAIDSSAHMWRVTLLGTAYGNGAAHSSMYLIRTSAQGAIGDRAAIYEGSHSEAWKLDSSYNVVNTSYTQKVGIVCEMLQ